MLPPEIIVDPPQTPARLSAIAAQLDSDALEAEREGNLKLAGQLHLDAKMHRAKAIRVMAERLDQEIDILDDLDHRIEDLS
jgi:hypothetical protein